MILRSEFTDDAGQFESDNLVRCCSRLIREYQPAGICLQVVTSPSCNKDVLLQASMAGSEHSMTHDQFHNNFYDNPSVPWWKKLSGYLLIVVVLFVVGAVSGLLKSDIGSAGALRYGYVYARAGVVMLVVAAVVLGGCRKLKLGALVSSIIGFGAAVGSMQAMCEALTGHYDYVVSSGMNGIAVGAICGAITYWRQKSLVTQQGASSKSNEAP